MAQTLVFDKTQFDQLIAATPLVAGVGNPQAARAARAQTEIYLGFAPADILFSDPPLLALPQQIVSLRIGRTRYTDPVTWTRAWRAQYQENLNRGLRTTVGRYQVVIARDVVTATGQALAATGARPALAPAPITEALATAAVVNAVTVVNGQLIVSFTDGTQSNQGSVGVTGPAGEPGAVGPAPGLTVGTVTQGSEPAVTVTGGPVDYELNFTVPSTSVPTASTTVLGGVKIDGSTIGISSGTISVQNGVFTTGSYSDPAWITSLSAAKVGLGNVTNESKATMFTSPTFTGTVSGVSATMVGLGNVTNESKATMFTAPTFTSGASVTGGTATTSTTTGTLTVTGGVGISGGLNVGAAIGMTNGSESYAFFVNAQGQLLLLQNAVAGGTFTGTAIMTLDDDGGGVEISQNLTVGGNLTVNGTTTTINSSTLAVDDKNLELASVVAATGLTGTITSTAQITTITGMNTTVGLLQGQALSKTAGTGAFGSTPLIVSVDSATQITIGAGSANTAGAITFNAGGATDTTANGGGITVKGATDKTIVYQQASDLWQISPGITATSIQNTPIGSTTASTGAFTTLSATGTVTIGTIAVNSTVNVNGIINTSTMRSSAKTGDLTVSGNYTLDCSLFDNWSFTVTGATTLLFSNVPSAGRRFTATLIITQGAGATGSIAAFPTGTVWPGGIAPTLTATAARADVFVLTTVDGGTKWFGVVVGQNYP